MGVLPQQDILFPELTAVEHVRLFSAFKGVRMSTAEIESLLADFDLGGVDNRVTAFSGGMKRKLSMLLALVGGSKIVLLDEPTTGM